MRSRVEDVGRKRRRTVQAVRENVRYAFVLQQLRQINASTRDTAFGITGWRAV